MIRSRPQTYEVEVKGTTVLVEFGSRYEISRGRNDGSKITILSTRSTFSPPELTLEQWIELVEEIKTLVKQRGDSGWDTVEMEVAKPVSNFKCYRCGIGHTAAVCVDGHNFCSNTCRDFYLEEHQGQDEEVGEPAPGEMADIHERLCSLCGTELTGCPDKESPAT